MHWYFCIFIVSLWAYVPMWCFEVYNRSWYFDGLATTFSCDRLHSQKSIHKYDFWLIYLLRHLLSNSILFQIKDECSFFWKLTNSFALKYEALSIRITLQFASWQIWIFCNSSAIFTDVKRFGTQTADKYDVSRSMLTNKLVFVDNPICHISTTRVFWS